MTLVLAVAERNTKTAAEDSAVTEPNGKKINNKGGERNG